MSSSLESVISKIETTNVRPAKDNDIEDIVLMFQSFLREGLYKVGYTLNLPTFLKHLFAAVDTEDECLVVAEHDGTTVGVFLGTLEPSYTNANQLEGCEILFYVQPEYRGNGIARKLMCAFEGWCRKKGAKKVVMGAVSEMKGEKLGKLYQRAGYKPYEVSFYKDLTKEEVS